MTTAIYFFAICLFLMLCFLLCSVILVQEGKSSGLGASFGGDPNESLFGTSTADVLKKVTAVLAIVFFTSCIFLSIWTSAMGHKTVNSGPVLEEFEEQ